MTRGEFDKAMNLGYRDRFGFPVSRKGDQDPAGNCLMFLGEEYVIKSDLGLEPEDRGSFYLMATLCQTEIGNFRRTPKDCPFSKDQEGWDDFMGLTTAALLMKGGEPDLLPVAVVMFGRAHFFRWGPFRFRYCWPTPKGDADTIDERDPAPWLGRYLQFVAHLRWCVGETPSLLQRFVWCWSIAFAGWNDPDGQDPWRLTYLMVRARKLRRRWWHPENLAERIWRMRFLKRWPGGISDVRRVYFKDGDHPLAVFASMEF